MEQIPLFTKLCHITYQGMSSLWTPDGERPIKREPTPPATSVAGDRGSASISPDNAVGGPGSDREPTAEEVHAMQEELRAMTEELVQVPASAVVANHCIGFFQLAAAHLQVDPPNLSDAQVAIDAMSSVIDGLRGRLGPDESTLVDALAQIRLAYVQVSGAFGSR